MHVAFEIAVTPQEEWKNWEKFGLHGRIFHQSIYVSNTKLLFRLVGVAWLQLFNCMCACPRENLLQPFTRRLLAANQQYTRVVKLAPRTVGQHRQVRTVCSAVFSTHPQGNTQLKQWLSKTYTKNRLCNCHHIKEWHYLFLHHSWSFECELCIFSKHSSQRHYKLFSSLRSECNREANIDRLISVWMWLCSDEW